MQIEVLFVDGCPNHHLARRNLDAALAHTNLRDVSVKERQVDSEADAKRYGMRGSPTILIDGRDPFGSQADEPSVSCRLYAGGGAPSTDDLVAALQRWSHIGLLTWLPPQRAPWHVLAQIQSAYNALMTGDPDLLVALMAQDVEWRGVPRGLLRRHTPRWRTPEEARAALEDARNHLREHEPRIVGSAAASPAGRDRYVVELRWGLPGAESTQHFQELRVRDGRVEHMRDLRRRPRRQSRRWETTTLASGFPLELPG